MASDVREFVSRFHNDVRPGAQITVVPHVKADGDAIGSGLALCGVLRKCGYEARLLLDEEVPGRLSFLPEIDSVQVYADEEFDPDVLFVIDCHEAHRLERRAVLWERAEQRFCIDHHRFHDVPKAEEWMESERSSTAEMVALFLSELESVSNQVLLDKTIATQLTCGIYSDTGGLRFSNSGAETYRVMARLRESGVRVDEVSEALFSRSSLPKLRARGLAFQKAKWVSDGRIAWIFFSNEDKKLTRADEDDVGGICSDLREVEGTVAAFFFQTDEKEEKLFISIRSTEGLNSAALASRWGGGGHDRAAGAEVELKEKDIQSVIDQVLAMAEEMLD